MTLVPVPTLDQLAAAPGRARELPAEVAEQMLLALAPIMEVLRLQALRGPASGNGGQPEAPAEDRLLTVPEAARKLGRSADWLYRHSKKLPFTVQDGSLLRFSHLGIERYIRQRQGR